MKRATVLVVEDNPITLKMVRIALEAEGHRVLEAGSGREALEHLAQSPDLVLQDLGLADMDGFELATRIRSRPEGRDVPLVRQGIHVHVERVVRRGAGGGERDRENDQCLGDAPPRYDTPAFQRYSRAAEDRPSLRRR